MPRLIIPLFVLTVLLWLALYAAPKSPRNKTLAVVRQIAVACALAALVLSTVSALFYIGELIK